MGRKHFYLTFDDSVPEVIEKEYNRIVRKEDYLLEKDALGNAVFFGDEYELHRYNIVGCITRDEKLQAERKNQLQDLDLLRKALDELRKEYPTEYEVITGYYFSEKGKSMRAIGEERGVSKQAIDRTLKRAYTHLKNYIILHRKENE